ncbi:porin [Paraburkholderia nemoris]|uniref:porin n=1 Tax=Paraburkholderia nemoris TaxID=2793076 RepID=UPI001B27B773|nr:porin [Paraburkholderia nemoris]CAE6835835.1 Outer membrane porin protein [Paraburkholderia nemoris]
MRKNFLGLAFAIAMPVLANAQSSVTLYGVVDVGVVYTNNVKTASGGSARWAMLSGNESGSRWGMLGTEDLGGGNKAIFRLENGFNVNDGTLAQQGREFGRQAYVGVTNSHFGTLTAGRQYAAIQDFVQPLDLASPLTSFATHPFDNDGLVNSFRIDNSVKYATPLFSGFQAEAMYGFSNSTGFANNRAYSVGAGYARGPLTLGAGYVHANMPSVSLGTGGALTSAPLPGTGMDQWGAAASYALGPVTLGLLYTGSIFTDSPTAITAPGGTVRFQNYEGSVRYQITPALVFAAGEAYTSVRQAGISGHYLETSMGVDYFLSKRTDVYLNGFFEKASSNLGANITFAGGPSSGRTQIVAVTGIRHRF